MAHVMSLWDSAPSFSSRCSCLFVLSLSRSFRLDTLLPHCPCPSHSDSAVSCTAVPLHPGSEPSVGSNVTFVPSPWNRVDAQQYFLIE